MQAWQNLKIGTRLALGIGALLLLLGGVAGTAYFSLQRANDNFSDYRSLARRTAAAGLWDGDLLTARVAVKTFLLNDTPESADKVRSAVAVLTEEVQKGAQIFSGSENAETVTTVDDRAKAYATAFEQVLTLKNQNDPHTAVMNDLGPKIEQNLNAIMESANADGDVSATFGAGQALRRILLARVYAMKFMKDNLTEESARVRQELAGLTDALTRLDAELQNPERRKLAADAAKQGIDYAAAFEQVRVLTAARNEIVQGTLDRIGPEVSVDLGRIADATKAQQDELGPRAAAAIDRGVMLALVISAIAVLAALGIGYAVARSITRPIVAMTGAMGILAEGNLETEVPAQGRKDEIGGMAAAVQVFKDNMIRNKAMQAREGGRAGSPRQAQPGNRGADRGFRPAGDGGGEDRLLRRDRDAGDRRHHERHGGADLAPGGGRFGGFRRGFDQCSDRRIRHRGIDRLDQRDHQPDERDHANRRGRGRAGQRDHQPGARPLRCRAEDRRRGAPDQRYRRPD